MDPIKEMNRGWHLALEDSPLRQKSAVCLSTLDADGYPRGRFVDLKRVEAAGLVVCTDYGSPKARQLTAQPRAALTAWWDHVGLQVRVVGDAAPTSAELSDELWRSRSRDAQLTTLASRQSEPLVDERALHDELQRLRAAYEGRDVPRPASWGGLRLRPLSFEFLTFREDRLHRRQLVERHGEGWRTSRLMP